MSTFYPIIRPDARTSSLVLKIKIIVKIFNLLSYDDDDWAAVIWYGLLATLIISTLSLPNQIILTGWRICFRPLGLRASSSYVEGGTICPRRKITRERVSGHGRKTYTQTTSNSTMYLKHIASGCPTANLCLAGELNPLEILSHL